MNKRPFRFGAREAWATASVRPTASSLSRSEARWNLAVWTEMPSRRAITLFDAPWASSARTSSSRGVSGTSPSANGETAVEMRRARADEVIE